MSELDFQETDAVKAICELVKTKRQIILIMCLIILTKCRIVFLKFGMCSNYLIINL